MKDLEIEKIVIQKLIFDENYISQVNEKFFTIPIAKHIFKHLQEIQKSDNKIVPETIALNAQTDKFSLFDIFTYCNVGNAHIESPRYYINFLKEKYFKEKFIGKIQKSLSDLSDPQNDFFDIFADFDRFRSEIEEEVKEENTSLQSGLNDSLEEMYQRISDFRENKKGFQLGYENLDNLVTLQGGDLAILAARPSQGKTSLANNFALNLARNRKSIFYISLEVTATSLSNRILLSENSDIDFTKFKHGSLNNEEIQKIENSVTKFDDLNIRIKAGGSQLETVLKNINIDKQRNNTDLVIIDYIQLIRSNKGNTENEQLTYISAMLKDLALRLKIPFIVLAQLNRDIEKRTEKRHKTSDIRGSGAIEQDADVMMFIYNKFLTDKKEGLIDLNNVLPSDRYLELQIQKNRNGETGDVNLFYNETVSKFYDSADKIEQSDGSLPF